MSPFIELSYIYSKIELQSIYRDAKRLALFSRFQEKDARAKNVEMGSQFLKVNLRSHFILEDYNSIFINVS